MRVFSAFVGDAISPGRGYRAAYEAETAAIVRGRNETAHEVSDTLLTDGFDRQVVPTPDAVAVVFEGESLTYGEFVGAGESACAASGCRWVWVRSRGSCWRCGAAWIWWSVCMRW